MPTLRAVILDFDGLILETEGTGYAAWRELFLARGTDYSIDEYLRIVGTHYTQEGAAFDPYQLLDQRTGRAHDWRELDAERRRHEDRLNAALVVQPGVRDLLAAAHARRMKTAVASSSSHDWVDRHLRHHGLLDRFDAIICRSDAPRVKPEPDLYLETIRRLGVAPEEAVAFEDSHHGSLSAKRAGLWCVVVPTAITAVQDFSHCDMVVPSLAIIDLDALPGALARP